MPKFLANLDLNKNELQNAVVQPLGTAPSTATAVEGQIYYDNTNGDQKIYVFNGTDWVAVGEGAGGTFNSFTVSDGTDTRIVNDGETFTISGGTGITSNETGTDTAPTIDVSITDGGVGTTQLASNAVTTAKITDANVTTAKLANSAVTTVKINNDAVTYAKLQNVSANSILGNNTGSAANAIELTAAQVRTLINVADGATSNAGTVTSVGTNTGLSGTVTTSGNLSLALNDLTDMTEAWVTGIDEFIVLDNGVQKRKLSSEIFGSNAFNSTTIGTTTNNLTVDNTTLQLNSGTTFNGSAARTISAKTGTITNGATTLTTGNAVFDFYVAGGSNLATALNTDLGGNFTIGNQASDTATFTGGLTVGGDLTVQGTTTTIDTVNLNVEDNNITLNYHATNDTSGSANGAGITIQDAVNSTTDATILWNAANDEFDFSHTIDAPTIKINGTAISATATELNQLDDVSVGGTATGDIVTIDGTQTLTNKSIAASQINSGTIANARLDQQLQDVAGLSPTDGNFIVGDGTNFVLESGSTARASLGVDYASVAQAKAGASTDTVLTPDRLAERMVVSTVDVSNATFTAQSGTYYAAVNHALGTEDIIVQLFDSSTKATVYADVERKNFAGTNSTNDIRIGFAAIPDNDVEVVITSVAGAQAKTASYS